MARPLIYSYRSSRQNVVPSTSRLAPMANESTADLTTSVLVRNLHCSSCVRTIEEALSALSPPPTAIHISIVSQSVVVQHHQGLTASVIQAALEDAGFDVSSDAPAASQEHSGVGLPSGLSNGVTQILSGSRRKHIQQCSLCQEEGIHSASESKLTLGRHIVGTDVLPSDTIPIGETPGTERLEGPFRLVLSVGGMTCSSCSGTITKMVTDIDGVSEVAVSLLSKSATVIIDTKELVGVIVETVEDCGFEAEFVSVESTAVSHDDDAAFGPRTVALRIQGMFCHHCPEKAMKALESIHPSVQITKPITAYTDPVLEVSYQPAPPSFTIRHIIAAIEGSKSPPFEVSIHQPASIEERARSMQAREQRALLYRFLVALVTAIPTFIIGIVFMSLVKDGNATKDFFMEPMWAGNASRSQWALFILATPVMFYSANLFHRRSIKEIRALWRKGSPTPILKRFVRFGSMNLLVSTGVSVAYFSSIAILALATAEPRSSSGEGDNTTYFDSVVFLTMFLLAGRLLEAYSKAHTADAITALGSLRPNEALLLTPAMSRDSFSTEYSKSDDLEKGDQRSEDDAHYTKAGFITKKVDSSLLEVGDIVRIASGSTPPADGTIISGQDCTFDESSLTGESRLIKKSVGDKVFLGTINKSGMVDVRVDARGGTTMLDHIIQVVREGQTRRAPIERVADFLTGYFVPAVTLLAIVTWVVWLTLGVSGALPDDYLDIAIGGWPVWSLEFAIAVFVVACPCGIGLAAPTALLVGSGLAAKFGILARGGGEAFQEMAQVDVVVFDKTGTLTEGGEPAVSDYEIFDTRWERSVILGIAAELESSSSHPLGKAINSFCLSQKASQVSGSMFEEAAGRGLKARFEDRSCTAIIGNQTWIEDHDATINGTISGTLNTWKSQAKSVIILAIRDDSAEDQSSFEVVAIFSVADRIRPEAKSVIAHLQGEGIGTWMISGDNDITANAVAKYVGIDASHVIANVLPHEKAQKIQWLQQVGVKRKESRLQRTFRMKKLNNRCVVAMIGDGINDAPALTAADIGIAIGSGSDVAISSASFILMSSNLRTLMTLCDLSRTVFNRVKFNFLYAAMYNVVALPIAAGVIYPAGHARLAPVWASLAMALSSVTVVCSSLLMKLYKEPKSSHHYE